MCLCSGKVSIIDSGEDAGLAHRNQNNSAVAEDDQSIDKMSKTENMGESANRKKEDVANLTGDHNLGLNHLWSLKF